MGFACEWIGTLSLPDECWYPLSDVEVIVLAPEEWHRQLVSPASDCAPVYRLCQLAVAADELRCAVREKRSLPGQCSLYSLQFIAKQPGRRCAVSGERFGAILSDWRSQRPQCCGDTLHTYSTMLRQVALENFTASWSHCRQKYTEAVWPDQFVPTGDTQDECVTSHDDVIRHLLQRTYALSVKRLRTASAAAADGGGETPIEPVECATAAAAAAAAAVSVCDTGCLVPAVALLETPNGFIVVSQWREHRLSHCAHFCSQSLLHNTAKLLLIVYQLLRAVKSLHAKGVPLGLARAADVAVDQLLWVRVQPRLDQISLPESGTTTGAAADATAPAQVNGVSECGVSTIGDSLCHKDLEAATQAWAVGRLSNLDYLLLVNAAAGRRLNDPGYHAVVPWVTDLQCADGRQWRPLFRSKFRLAKGDEQLRQQYKTALTSGLPAYHVSDVLSEITYYVYMARRTPRSVLCRHVRSHWVPAEYPGSMSRLYQWTPDECIPQFYTDPSIFKSVHSDLPDLVLPEWADSADSFIKLHRAALESPQVSAHLHHWLNLTFGHKLVGKAAVDAMNVCRHLCEETACVSRSGVVQVFSRPHPRRLPPPHPLTSLASLLVAGSGSGVGDDDDTNTSNSSRMASHSDRSSGLDTVVEHFTDDSLIRLPAGCDFVAQLRLIESFGCVPDNDVISRPRHSPTDCHNRIVTGIHTQRVRDLATCLCILVEIALPLKFRRLPHSAVSSHPPTLEARLNTALSALSGHQAPLCLKAIKPVLCDLLHFERAAAGGPSGSGYSGRAQHQTPTALPSLDCLLDPARSPLPLPADIGAIYRAFAQFAVNQSRHQMALLQHGAGSSEQVDAAETWASEFCCATGQLLVGLSCEWLQLVTDRLLELLRVPAAAVVCVWRLWGAVGRRQSRATNVRLFLQPLLQVYRLDWISYKSIKLFHRTMLSHLIARLGNAVFLKHFSPVLAQAVGGDTTDKPSDSPSDFTSAGEFRQSESHKELGVFTMDEEMGEGSQSSVARAGASGAPPSDKCNNDANAEGGAWPSHVASVAAESVLWLAHRVGPVLTCRHLTVHLLKTLPLCYSHAHALSCSSGRAAGGGGGATDQWAVYVVRRCGDCTARRLLHCLRAVAQLYGPCVVAPHYTRHVRLMSRQALAGARSHAADAGATVQATLMALASLLLHVLPLLTDSRFVEVLTNLVDESLAPCVHLLLDSSSSSCCCSDSAGRSALLQRWLCLVVMVTRRLGHELSVQLMSAILVALVQAFVQHASSDCKPAVDGSSSGSSSEQLRTALTDSLADYFYTNCCHLLVKLPTTLCSVRHVQTLRSISARHRRHSLPILPPGDSTIAATAVSVAITAAAAAAAAGSSSSGGFDVSPVQHGRGNRMVLQSGDVSEHVTSGAGSSDGTSSSGSSNNKMAVDNTRHLAGTWLDYWSTELDSAAAAGGVAGGWLPRQVCLQSFEGHTGAVRQLCVLDSENSFLSASKDRTVKLWSIRNQGDGSHKCCAQWTYSQHRRPLCDVTYLATNQRVVSCDSHQVHVWDPFIGVTDTVLDNLGTIQSVCSLSEESQFLLVCTAECSLKLLDLRTGRVSAEWKSWPGHGWPERLTCVTCSSQCREPTSGHWVAAGHTHGGLTLLDMRCGRIISSWRSGEAEVAAMTCVSGCLFECESFDLALTSPQSLSPGQRATALITHSADSPLTVWSPTDGRPTSHLRGVSESVTSLHCYRSSLLSVAGAGRVYVHHLARAHCSDATLCLSSPSVSSVQFKGGVSALAALKSNGLLVVASDTGSIKLVY